MVSGGLWVTTGVPGGHCGVTSGRACPPVPQLTAERRSARAAGNGLGTDPPRLGEPPLQGRGLRGYLGENWGGSGGYLEGTGESGSDQEGLEDCWGSPVRG